MNRAQLNMYKNIDCSLKMKSKMIFKMLPKIIFFCLTKFKVQRELIWREKEANKHRTGSKKIANENYWKHIYFQMNNKIGQKSKRIINNDQKKVLFCSYLESIYCFFSLSNDQRVNQLSLWNIDYNEIYVEIWNIVLNSS